MPDTLLGFETTGPATRWGRPSPVGVVERVVALLWWWGVVFDSWIVVASIGRCAGFRVGVSFM